MNNNRLLLVDDEVELLDLLKDRFELEGFEVLTATNGREAFKIYKEKSICAIISDVRMPNGDGIELLKKVREIESQTPIISFITAYADISLRDAYNLGVDGVFSKPYNFSQLLNHIQRLLLSKEQRWKNPGLSKDLATVEEQFQSLDTSIKNKSLNLGRGGFVLFSKNDFPSIEEHVSFKLHFQEDQPRSIFGFGRVKWKESTSSDSHFCGVEFYGLEKSSRSQVIGWIDKHKPIAFIPNLKTIDKPKD